MLFPLLLSLLLLLLARDVLAVDRGKFRTCATTGFCAAYRNTAGPHDFLSSHSLLTLSPDASTLSNEFLKISCLATGAFRVRITRPGEAAARWESDQVLVDTTLGSFSTTAGEGKYVCQANGAAVKFDAELVRIEFYRNALEKVPFQILNHRGLTYIESALLDVRDAAEKDEPAALSSSQSPQDQAERKIIDWGEDGKPIYENAVEVEEEEVPAAAAATMQAPTTSRAAPESFGGFTDAKPNGPNSVGFDATFTEEEVHLFGLPEHATSFSLQDTTNRDPFRLYNLDVFEYELEETMALYGAVPFILSRSAKTGKYSGLFFNNPTETFVDISTNSAQQQRETRWVSECGVLDIFVFPGGDAMRDVLTPYVTLTGKPALPPLYALGYHQCRWNYRDQRDLLEVLGKFEELDFPMDVLWLDIEHTDGKRYFTWDATKFPDPIAMQNELARTGRRLVTIVDPHVKRDPAYYVHAEAEKQGYYIKDGEGNKDFEGWCWSGSSSYPDFTNARVREWWSGLYQRYEGSTNRLAIWNDMNEMSVFNGPEVTMKKTAKNLDGVEHREWHNLYGMHYHQATYEGLVRARGGDRPFVLTRSFFAGTQRFGAIWNGDNKADWTHLRITPAMLLSLSVAGLPFVGADVGGFFGNPSTELLVRWYESASMQPFFRAHAHIETKRREPWLFGAEALAQIRNICMERYRVLPYLYTLFEEARSTGVPVMRPVFTKRGTALEHAWLLGDDLLVLPALHEAQTKVELAREEEMGAEYVDFDTGRRLVPGIAFDAPLGRAPVFHRAGSILPKQMRLRRSSELMRNDPFTLFVALDSNTGSARGSLFLDDRISLTSESVHVEYTMQCQASGKCTLRAASTGAYEAENKLERIILQRNDLACSSTLTGTAKQLGKEWTFQVECDARTGNAVWRKPWVDATKPFELQVE